MGYEGHGYVGRCRFNFKWNSTNCQPSKVTTRKMTEEEKIKYGVKTSKESQENIHKEV